MKIVRQNHQHCKSIQNFMFLKSLKMATMVILDYFIYRLKIQTCWYHAPTPWCHVRFYKVYSNASYNIKMIVMQFSWYILLSSRIFESNNHCGNFYQSSIYHTNVTFEHLSNILIVTISNAWFFKKNMFFFSYLLLCK